MNLFSKWFTKKQSAPVAPPVSALQPPAPPLVADPVPAPAAPSSTQENTTMSILQTLESGVGKAIAFITKVYTKTSEIDKILVSLTPQTKAAVLATYYDAVKTGMAAVTVAQDVATGNFPAAITLSESTVALVKQNVVDIKNDVAVAKADAVALGILSA